MTRLRDREADLEQSIARLGRADIIGPLVSSEDIETTWNALGTARKRTIVELLFGDILIHPVGRGVRHFNPESVTVCWRDPAVVGL